MEEQKEMNKTILSLLDKYKHSSISSISSIIKLKDECRFPYFCYFLSKLLFVEDDRLVVDTNVVNHKENIISKLKESMKPYLEEDEEWNISEDNEELISLGMEIHLLASNNTNIRFEWELPFREGEIRHYEIEPRNIYQDFAITIVPSIFSDNKFLVSGLLTTYIPSFEYKEVKIKDYIEWDEIDNGSQNKDSLCTFSNKSGINYIFSKHEINDEILFIEYHIDHISAKENKVFFGVCKKNLVDTESRFEGNKACFGKSLLQLKKAHFDNNREEDLGKITFVG
eukprot:TRINITY_DN840_c1_g4_i1.p1 TRINITY_DN840_c1_g4~~TRINITY_DN840_c1_g4_i1.p1  ORF type:complete len:283 (-),score=71.48 TRINITY_DN840_c1_g4_i1:35-883(-)